jgi:hypothetical protein
LKPRGKLAPFAPIGHLLKFLLFSSGQGQTVDNFPVVPAECSAGGGSAMDFFIHIRAPPGIFGVLSGRGPAAASHGGPQPPPPPGLLPHGVFDGLLSFCHRSSLCRLHSETLRWPLPSLFYSNTYFRSWDFMALTLKSL